METGTRAVLVCAAVLFGCQSTGVVSPQHPYDFRGKQCSSTPSLSSSEMPCVMAALDQEEATCYKKTGQDATVCRDTVVGITKKFIDQYWRNYVSAIYGQDAGMKTVLETSVASLGAAAAITTPPSAASIVSATSASLSTLNTSLQKNLWNSNTADLLLGQMEADRYVVDQRIRQSLKDGANVYPLVHAMSDLAAYSLTMSVPHALQSLRQAGGKDAQRVKEQVVDDLVVNARPVSSKQEVSAPVR